MDVMKKFSIYVLLVALLIGGANIQCSTGANLLSSGSSLLSKMGGIPNLSQITSLLQTPGLSKLIGGALKKPFTLLAPTNEALSSAAGSLGNLADPSNLNKLGNLLKDHIIPGKKDAAALASGAKTASGNALDLAGATLGNIITDDKFNIIPVDKILSK